MNLGKSNIKKCRSCEIWKDISNYDKDSEICRSCLK